MVSTTKVELGLPGRGAAGPGRGPVSILRILLLSARALCGVDKFVIYNHPHNTLSLRFSRFIDAVLLFLVVI